MVEESGLQSQQMLQTLAKTLEKVMGRIQLQITR